MWHSRVKLKIGAIWTTILFPKSVLVFSVIFSADGCAKSSSNLEQIKTILENAMVCDWPTLDLGFKWPHMIAEQVSISRATLSKKYSLNKSLSSISRLFNFSRKIKKYFYVRYFFDQIFFIIFEKNFVFFRLFIIENFALTFWNFEIIFENKLPKFHIKAVKVSLEWYAFKIKKSSKFVKTLKFVILSPKN